MAKLSNVERHTFTEMDPSLVPSACEVVGIIPYLYCIGDSIYNLTVSNFGGQAPYTYDIGNGFQSSNVFPNIIVGNTYTITVRDVNGCEYSTTTTIYPGNCNQIDTSQNTPVDIEPSILFPNVFTPNGDFSNDNFYFPNQGIEELECVIYNRWGMKIYEWNTINGFWDGRTTAGKECPDGVYYYIVSYKTINSEGREEHTGFISLLR